MIHSSFFGACDRTRASAKRATRERRNERTVSISSGSSWTCPGLGAFFPAPLAHGETLALKSVAAPELMDLANRRMSSV